VSIGILPPKRRSDRITDGDVIENELKLEGGVRRAIDKRKRIECPDEWCPVRKANMVRMQKQSRTQAGVAGDSFPQTVFALELQAEKHFDKSLVNRP